MSNIYSISNLFTDTTAKNKTSVSSMFSASLSDYNMIRSGAYSKLARTYYSSEKNQTGTENKKTSVQNNEMKMINSNASALESSARSLLKTDVKEENIDDVYKKASDFVDSYNKLIESGLKTEAVSVLRNISSMTKNTETNRNLLNDIGIKIGSENKLSIDESKFRNEANSSKIKTLFNDVGSYAYRMQTRAQSIQFAAVSELKKTGTYTSNGGYGSFSSIGSMYDGIM